MVDQKNLKDEELSQSPKFMSVKYAHYSAPMLLWDIGCKRDSGGEGEEAFLWRNTLGGWAKSCFEEK